MSEDATLEQLTEIIGSNMADTQADTSGTADDDTAGQTSDNINADGQSDAPGGDDWRAGIEDAALLKHAKRFTSPTEMAKAHMDLRQQLSTAITPLGKDANDEQLASYRKSIGVPEAADGYVFEVPADHEVTEAETAFQSAAADMFHGLNITADQAKGLQAWWDATSAKAKQDILDADKKHGDDAEAALKGEWRGDDYKKNSARGLAAAKVYFGDDFAGAKDLQDSNGRYLMDNPIMMKMFARVGREMEAHGADGIMTKEERQTVDEQVTELRKKQREASASGDRKAAEQYSEQERRLYQARDGDQPVVGASGRSA